MMMLTQQPRSNPSLWMPRDPEHAPRQDPLAAFLDAHLGRPQREDVGALLCQASVVARSGETMSAAEWGQAVSAAVSDAPRSASGH